MRIKCLLVIILYHLTLHHAFRLWDNLKRQRWHQVRQFAQKQKVEKVRANANIPVSQRDSSASLIKETNQDIGKFGAKLSTKSTEIDKLIANLPLTEKYSLLIQSYTDKILQTGEKREKDILLKIETLYSEMILRKISPEKKAVQNIIDAASSFCKVDQFARTIKILRKGGDLKAFGAVIGQLTSPIFQDLKSSFFNKEVIPKDEREKEVAVALGGFAFIFSWLGLQVLDLFSSNNYEAYDLLIAIMVGGSLGYDILCQQSKYIKLSIAGVERLFFRDPTRRSFLDASSFVSGYLLGLPSFCYTSRESEGMKMLQQHPETLQAYQQSLISPSILQKLRKSFQTYATSFSSTSLASSDGDLSFSIVQQNENDIISSFENVKELKSFLEEESNPFWSDEDRKLAVGRVLVWLMFPVAAEMAKYGQTLLSNPKRGYKFLDLIQERSKGRRMKNNKSSISESENRNMREFYKVASFLSETAKDREALLEWAYFEANSLLRQYGDVIERVDEFLRTGTATVGECVLLIEEEVIR